MNISDPVILKRLRAFWFLLCLSLVLFAALPLAGQLLGQGEKPAEQTQTDPYDRDSPHGAFLGFLRTAQRGDWQAAVHYLQVPDGYEGNPESLARETLHLLDRAYLGDLDSISRRPEGTLDDGLQQNLDRAGMLVTDRGEIEVSLARVQMQSSHVWLLSSSFLQRVPAAYDRLGVSIIERHLPPFLLAPRLLSLPVWLWVLGILAFPIAVGVAIVVVWIIVGLIRKIRRTENPGVRIPLRSRPGVFIIAIALHYSLMMLLGLPLLYRQYYNRLIMLMLLFGLCWLAFRWIDLASVRLQLYLANTNNIAANALVMLGRRLVKVAALLIFILFGFAALGVDLAPALAGLGIGGIALALAAQKTVENLFGGLAVLSDRSIRAGDTLRIGTMLGTVEDIGLRSTSLRLLDRSLAFIPNGLLYATTVENLSRRDKFLVRHTIGLRYETTADQLRYVLAKIRELLYAHSKIETDSARIRFVQFGDSSLNLEIFAYALAADWKEYLAIQEDLLLQVMAVVEASGTSVAFPSRTIYFSKDSGMAAEKLEAAQSKVFEWRSHKELPFPDHDKGTVEEVKDTIDYPPPESSLRREQ